MLCSRCYFDEVKDCWANKQRHLAGGRYFVTVTVDRNRTSLARRGITGDDRG